MLIRSDQITWFGVLVFSRFQCQNEDRNVLQNIEDPATVVGHFISVHIRHV
jgi:hypothetical protein